MKTIIISVFVVLLSITAFAQQSLINIGPMVGYAQIREAMLWIQTKEAARVQFNYWAKDSSQASFWTQKVNTTKQNAFTAKCIADSVQPGKTYQYAVYINDEKAEFPYATEFQTLPVWMFRTSEPPTFKVALGSCAYINEAAFDRPGKPYGGDYHIFSSIHEKNPDLMLWLGDNVYLREADWNSRTGVIARYSHDRAIAQLQPLFASVHHYHIWDDHDYGPNDSDESFWMKNQTLDVFELFTANPSYGIGDIKGAISFFNWNDIDFILLDNRTYRNPNHLPGNNKTILGAEQLNWLKKTLVSSKGSFKMVAMGGQFLNTAKNYETYANYGFENERQEIIDFIYANDIRNVVFLSGDRHHTELSVLDSESHPRIIDITISPFTSSAAKNVTEQNLYRIEGTLIDQRNFGILEFRGPIYERQIIISTFDSNGKQLWRKEFNQE